MVKVAPFSPSVCNELLAAGYTLLVIKSDFYNDYFENMEHFTLFEAVKATSNIISIPVNEMMDTIDKTKTYYVIYKIG